MSTMVSQYIERALLRKNRGVYFKKGKWIFHALFLVATWSLFILSQNSKNTININGTVGALPAFLSVLIFAVFFYIYCLYLIPVCFKRGHYRKFWILLVLLMVAFPAINVGAQWLLMHVHPAFHYLSKKRFWLFTREMYGSFVSYFLGVTTLLYLMELLEEIRTAKEIQQNSLQLAATEQQLIKTRMDPEFVIRSLDGISQLAADKHAEAPDSVIRFSDILRYRLYRSTEPYVAIEEELQQLSNLVLFHNSIHDAAAFCTLEIEGSPYKKRLPPLSVINLVEPLLNLYLPQASWSLLIYLLIEETEAQLAIELVTPNPQLAEITVAIQANLQSIFGSLATFTQEQEENTNSIRICLPILSH